MNEIQKLNIAAQEILSLAMDQLDLIKDLKASDSDESIKEAEDRLSTLTDAYGLILYRIISKIEKI